MILIGLGAKARQGKNFVCNYWLEAVPELKVYAFADALKEYCRDHHDELVAQYYRVHQLSMAVHPISEVIGQPKDDPIYGYTKVLQWFGTWKRSEDPNYWVDIVAAKLNEGQPDIAAITDVRFLNEAQFIKDNGGYVVEVIRRNEDGSRYLDPNRDPKHISETALDDYTFDYSIIARSGDLESLKSKALGVLSNIISTELAKAEEPTDIDVLTDFDAFPGIT